MSRPTEIVLPERVRTDKVIAKLREAEKALQYVTTIHQAKVLADVAAAQELFAHRQRLGDAITGYAHEIKIYALAKLGELLRDMPKNAGARGIGKSGVTPKNPTYTDLGLDKKTASVAQQLAALPTPMRDAIAHQEQTLTQALRERKAVETRRKVSLPDAKYRVIYADPPWSYVDKGGHTGAVQSKGAEHHYPSMTIAELCALPIQGLTDSDAVLFLWVTSPLLFQCAPVIAAWGFDYRASFVWDKVKHNMGHYNSVRHEFLLVCVRGSCQPDASKLYDSVQSIERTTHSTKPELFREIIDTLYPHGRRIELFARRPVAGWDRWGFEADAAHP
jgi:N6-adenosine-specific RNA methylase IME4